MSEKRLDDELAAVEAMLGSLTPAASRVGRDRLMFLAGRASVERLSPLHRRGAARLWPSAMAASLVAMTSIAAILLVMLLVERGQQVADRSVRPIASSAVPSADSQTRGSVAHASDRALLRRWLVEAERSRKFADIELPDERLPRGNSLAGNNSASAVNTAAGERDYENNEGLRSLQRELDIDRGPAQHLNSPSSNQKENRS
jgi:hypothetical protein